MSNILSSMLMAQKKDEAIAVEDVFSTDIWTGNSVSDTDIQNGIDLVNNEGMLWLKSRTTAVDNVIVDTINNRANTLIPNKTDAKTLDTNLLTFFNEDGYGLGVDNKSNESGSNYVGWTFRKAPKFFDVVTYTGTGASQNIPHDIDGQVGLGLFKRLDDVGGWNVIAFKDPYYAGSVGTGFQLNTDGASTTLNLYPISLTDTSFDPSVYNGGDANISGASYVAYLFANDDSDDGIIRCGSYTGTGAVLDVTLGWQCQYLMIKRVDSTGDWCILDLPRENNSNTVVGDTTVNSPLFPNTSDVEISHSIPHIVTFNSTKFTLNSTATEVNTSGATYIYMAIRAEGV